LITGTLGKSKKVIENKVYLVCCIYCALYQDSYRYY